MIVNRVSPDLGDMMEEELKTNQENKLLEGWKEEKLGDLQEEYNKVSRVG